MEGIKLAVFLTCCLLMLKVSLPAPIPTSEEKIQKLEVRVEELTEKLKLLKEEASRSLQPTKRQTSTTNKILNENRECTS